MVKTENLIVEGIWYLNLINSEKNNSLIQIIIFNILDRTYHIIHIKLINDIELDRNMSQKKKVILQSFSPLREEEEVIYLDLETMKTLQGKTYIFYKEILNNLIDKLKKGEKTGEIPEEWRIQVDPKESKSICYNISWNPEWVYFHCGNNEKYRLSTDDLVKAIQSLKKPSEVLDKVREGLKEKHFEVSYERFTPEPQGIHRITEHAKFKTDVENKYKDMFEKEKQDGKITSYKFDVHLIYDPNI